MNDQNFFIGNFVFNFNALSLLYQDQFSENPPIAKTTQNLSLALGKVNRWLERNMNEAVKWVYNIKKTHNLHQVEERSQGRQLAEAQDGVITRPAPRKGPWWIFFLKKLGFQRMSGRGAGIRLKAQDRFTPFISIWFDNGVKEACIWHWEEKAILYFPHQVTYVLRIVSSILSYLGHVWSYRLAVAGE